MQIRRYFVPLFCVLVTACAGNQEIEELGLDVSAGVVSTPGGLADAGNGASLCSAKAYGDQDRLDQNCLNRVDGLPNGGKRLNPIAREKKELSSLCDKMFLPKCRRKY